MTNECEAAAFDRTWLPNAMRAVPGLSIDALCVPGTRRAASSGAWYDAFPIADDRVVVALGDGAGGATAATTMQRLREMFCATCAEIEPAALLAAAITLVQRQSSAERATGLVGIIDLAEETFTYLATGRAAPCVRYHDGTVGVLPTHIPAAEAAQHDYPGAQMVLDLRGAALLVVYTDGLLNGCTTIETGLDRLRNVLDDNRLRYAARPTVWLARRMLDDRSNDDVAIVAAMLPSSTAVPPEGEAPRWRVSWSFVANADSSKAVRRAFLAYLESRASAGMTVDLSAAELIFGELLGNVVRHAPGLVEITLDWSADLPVLHVEDYGPGFSSRRRRERLPDDEFSESGRGLFIINACAVSFSVRNRNGRGTHATATLALVESETRPSS